MLMKEMDNSELAYLPYLERGKVMVNDIYILVNSINLDLKDVVKRNPVLS